MVRLLAKRLVQDAISPPEIGCFVVTVLAVVRVGASARESAGRASIARRWRGRTRGAPSARRRSERLRALRHARRPRQACGQAELRPRRRQALLRFGPPVRCTTRPRWTSTSARASAMARIVAASKLGCSPALIGRGPCRGRRRGPAMLPRSLAAEPGGGVEPGERVAAAPVRRRGGSGRSASSAVSRSSWSCHCSRMVRWSAMARSMAARRPPSYQRVPARCASSVCSAASRRRGSCGLCSICSQQQRPELVPDYAVQGEVLGAAGVEHPRDAARDVRVAQRLRRAALRNAGVAVT